MAKSLLQAVSECRIQHVKTLLGFGMNLTQVMNNTSGEGVLVTALKIEDCRKRGKMFNFLLKNGANHNEVDRHTKRDVITWACYLGRENEIRKLLDSCQGDIELCRKDKYGFTCLHYAAMFGLKDAVYQLCTGLY